MTPRARPLLPRYKGKRVNNLDLLEAINRANHKLLEASNLVDLISCKPHQAPVSNFFDSHRPTRATTHERTTGDILDDNIDHQRLSSSRHTQSLFRNMGLSPRQTRRTARHFVNMVSIRTLPEDKTNSTNSSIGSIPTEVLHPEDEDYNLDLPPYPRVFPTFRSFHHDEEIWFSTSAMTNQLLMAKSTNKDSSANNATSIVLSDGQMRSGN